MAKCVYCNSRKGKRSCPALNGLICSLCCGTHSGKEIDCDDDCKYYTALQENQHQKELKSIIRKGMLEVNPDLVGYDILAKTEDHSKMAYHIENTFLEIYLDNSRFDDKKARKILELIYCKYYHTEPTDITSSDEIISDLVENYKDLKITFNKTLSEDHQRKIILRLILSIKNMSGGRFGDYGYVNYLKNNLDTGGMGGTFVVEDKWGDKWVQKITDIYLEGEDDFYEDDDEE